MEQLAVPLVAIAISLATFIYTLITNAQKAEKDRVQKLEDRLTEVDRRLQECEDDRHDLRQEVIRLEKRVS